MSDQVLILPAVGDPFWSGSPALVGVVSEVDTALPITGGPITGTGTIGVDDFVGSGASHARGTVPDPGATPGTTKFLREDASFAVPPGTGGTVTNIATTAPITGGPITGAGTVGIDDFVGSGASHARGAVPDPGVTPGTTKFLREDASWATAGGAVSSVAGTAPIDVSPTTGATVVSIADFIASGASHARGAVPDPGAGAGSTKFLCEDASWAIPPGAGAVTSVDTAAPLTGGPITGTGTIAISDFVAAGASHARGTVPDPGASAHAPPYYLGDDGAWHNPTVSFVGTQYADNFDGDGATVAFTASNSVGGTIGVFLNGILQPKSGGGIYTIAGSVLTFVTAPLGGADKDKISWVYFGTTPTGQTPTQDDFTGDGATTDFVLTHVPTAASAMAFTNGVLQPLTIWSLIAPQTVRYVTAPLGGTDPDKISVPYRY